MLTEIQEAYLTGFKKAAEIARECEGKSHSLKYAVGLLDTIIRDYEFGKITEGLQK